MKISVIMASFNYARYLQEAIDSIINQSYQDWELIIVDDGSTDNSVEIIKSYCQKDHRIKLFQHEANQNKGLKDTLLLGLEHAQGDWIAFLETDDSFLPDNLAKKIEIVKNYPEVALVFNKVRFKDEELVENKNLKRFKKTQKLLSKMNFPANLFYKFYMKNNILTFSCVMVKASELKIEYFNTPIDSLLDWWLWIHMAFKNKFYYLDQEFTNWRLHKYSYINQKREKKSFMLRVWAYDDVCKNNKNELSLLVFILYSKARFLFVCGFRFISKLISKLFRNTL